MKSQALLLSFGLALAATVAVGVTSAACASSPKSEPSKQFGDRHDRQTVIKVVPYQTFGHRAVQVTIAGKTMPFLFDTGGGITLVTPAIAKSASCTPFGQLTGFRMRGERVDFQRCDQFGIDIGGFNTTGQAGVFDVNKLIPPDWPRLGGMVALSAFEGHVVTLNLTAGEASVREARASDEDLGAPLQLVRQASGYSVVALVPSQTEEGTLWLELDSGSDAPLMLSPTSAKLLGVDLAAPDVVHSPAVVAAPGVRPRIESWKVPRVKIMLPGIGEVETSATVLDIIYDGNIGAPLIEKFQWTVDLKHKRVQLTEVSEK